MTQKQMAEWLCLSWNGYWLKENGRRNFTASELVLICKKANINPNDVEF